MYNPLVIFTGAALATLAALMGVTYEKWSPRPPAETQLPREEAAAPAADLTNSPAAPVVVAPAEQPSTELASILPEEPTSARSAAEPPLAAPDASATVPDLSTAPTDLSTAPPEAPAEAPADEAKPSFDTVRIEPDGSAVIAGRGLPNSDVTVMLNGEPLGSAKSDTGGAWVFIPEEPVPPGDHQLTLRMLTGAAAAIYSDQSVALKVPDREIGEPLVVLSDPDRPSRVIQRPQRALVPAEAEEPVAAPAEEAGEEAEESVVAAAPETRKQDAGPTAAASMSLTLSTVDYNDAGDIIFSGTAGSNASVRLYVDNAAVGDASVATDGTWIFAGKEQIKPGTHTLRVDQLRGDGSVAERIELPFVRAKPQQVAALNQSVQPKTEPAGEPVAAESRAGDTPAAPQPETLPAEEPAAAVSEPAVAPAPAPDDTPADSAAKPDAAAAAAPATIAEPPEPAPAAMEEGTGTEIVAVAPSPADADTLQPAGEPPEVAPAATQPSATEVETNSDLAIMMPRKGQIVIQPGNSLWRISRVIYGRGIEYTIIYEANRNQIRDPNLIYPGQIFATPGVEPPALIDPASQTPLATTTDAPTSAQ